MAEKRSLKRLLRLRELEEEQSRAEVESRVGDRDRLEHDLMDTIQCQIQGRLHFVAAIGEGNSASRTGGLAEIDMAVRRRGKIQLRLEAANLELARQREEFLRRRTDRRQVETLLQEARSLEDVERARRAQQILDDWYGRRGSDWSPSKVGSLSKIVAVAERNGSTSPAWNAANPHPVQAAAPPGKLTELAPDGESGHQMLSRKSGQE